MKLSFIAITVFIATAMAAPTNSTIPNNDMGTVATASISVENPNVAKSAATQIHNGLAMVALTSAATAAYALF